MRRLVPTKGTAELINLYLLLSWIITSTSVYPACSTIVAQGCCTVISTKRILYSTLRVHIKALRQYNALLYTSRSTTSSLFACYAPKLRAMPCDHETHIQPKTPWVSLMNKRKTTPTGILQSSFIMPFVMCSSI
jgi:hypothetical protein